MVSISLYGGNLHRVSDAPRRYPMPPRAITLDQFWILTRRRDEALARLAVAANRNPNPSSGNKKDEEEEAKVKEEKKEERVEEGPDVFDPQPSKTREEAKIAKDSEPIDADAKGKGKSSDADAVKRSEIETTEEKPELGDEDDGMGGDNGNIERPPPIQRHLGPITLVHDLNVPYEGPIEE